MDFSLCNSSYCLDRYLFGESCEKRLAGLSVMLLLSMAWSLDLVFEELDMYVQRSKFKNQI